MKNGSPTPDSKQEDNRNCPYRNPDCTICKPQDSKQKWEKTVMKDFVDGFKFRFNRGSYFAELEAFIRQTLSLQKQQMEPEIALAHSSGVEEERGRIIEMWNKHCDEYSPADKYWADGFAIKLSPKKE